jgi:ribulose-phosphate 3-epimerase
MIEIAPSILSADFTRLGDEIAAAEAGGATYIHVDVMDGHFVPNLTVGPLVVEAARRATQLPIDTHLMIENPDLYIPAFAQAGSRMLSIHPEATYHLHRSLSLIRQVGCLAGLVLNPGTPLAFVEETIDQLDFVLLMSVNPGFGGQAFIPGSVEKLRRLRHLLDAAGGRGRRVRIEIDGGIVPENIGEVTAAGAEIIVAGSSVFGRPDPAAAVRLLLQRGEEGRVGRDLV